MNELDIEVKEALEHLRVSALDDYKLKFFNKMSIMESYNVIKQALSDKDETIMMADIYLLELEHLVRKLEKKIEEKEKSLKK